MDRKALRDSIRKELQENLLPFWRTRSIDHTQGGFVAEMACDGTLNKHASKGLVLNARMLWTFSILYREFHDDRDLALAQRAAEYLEKYFLDGDFGGYVWNITPAGGFLDSLKKIYGQAFCIYAWSEFYRATGRKSALDRALEIFQKIETQPLVHEELHCS